MIARLRKRFILIAMCSVILVLAVLMGIVNTMNFIKTDRSAGDLLQILTENNGSFPLNKHMTGQPGTDGPSDDTGTSPGGNLTSPTETQSGTAETNVSSFGGAPSGGPGGHRFMTEETPYETRYFSVRLNQDGSLVFVNTGKIAAVSTDEAVDLAQSLAMRKKVSGYSGNYKYLATEQSDGTTLYVFLDCTRDMSSVREFLVSSLLVSLCGIAAVFLLVVLLSRRAIRPVAESYDKQKQFITNAGHEIKTPLAIIDSCAEVIELEQGESKWTEGIRGQVQRLNSLTQSLVALARMDENQGNLVMESFSLTAAAQDTLEPFQLLAENHGKHLELQIQPDLTYRGNEQTIRQLFSILADNAVKYALKGSSIHIALNRPGKWVVLTCRNAAEGLKPGSQDKLFDRFYRGDASRSSKKGGYGIGLSMAQAIVAAHSGKITARSEDGASLTITVLL